MVWKISWIEAERWKKKPSTAFNRTAFQLWNVSLKGERCSFVASWGFFFSYFCLLIQIWVGVLCIGCISSSSSSSSYLEAIVLNFESCVCLNEIRDERWKKGRRRRRNITREYVLSYHCFKMFHLLFIILQNGKMHSGKTTQTNNIVAIVQKSAHTHRHTWWIVIIKAIYFKGQAKIHIFTCTNRDSFGSAWKTFDQTSKSTANSEHKQQIARRWGKRRNMRIIRIQKCLMRKCYLYANWLLASEYVWRDACTYTCFILGGVRFIVANLI